MLFNHITLQNGQKFKSFSQCEFPFGTLNKRLRDPLGFHHEAMKFASKNGGFHLEWIFTKPCVIVTSRKYVNELLGAKFTMKSSTRKGDETLPVLKMLFGRGLFMARSDVWKRQHRIAVRGVGSRHFRDFCPTVLDCAKRLIARIDGKMKLNGSDRLTLDVLDTLQAFTSEVAFKILFGRSLASEEMAYVGKKFSEVIDTGMHPMYMLNLYAHSSFTGPKQIREAIEKLHKICREAVKAFRDQKAGEDASGPRESSEADGSLLGALCAASDAGDALSDEEVVHNVYSFAGAGIETTSTAIANTLIALAEHPEIQDKLFQELQQDLKSKVQEPLDLSADDMMNGSPYLSAVIKESLRLYPPTGFVPFRHTTKPVTLGPLKIPTNTPVTTCLYSIARLEEWWGPNAKAFHPDRFLQHDQHAHSDSKSEPKPSNKDTNKHAKTNTKPAYNITDDMRDAQGDKFLSFGGGIRSCIGKGIAALEMRTMVAMLVKKYKFELLPEHAHLAGKDKHWQTNAFFLKPKVDRQDLLLKRR
ncbi:hypothetical protein AAMO2058_001552700 [Amorphochlora amoebiformis]